MTNKEKKKELFLNQKKLLEVFLSHGAITREQYNKSFGDLMLKMGFTEDAEPLKDSFANEGES